MVGDQIEQRLVGDEDCRQRETDDGADEEALGAHAVGQELFRHAHLAAVPSAVLRFGAGDDKGNPDAREKGHGQSEKDALGEKHGEGVRRIEAVDGDGQIVELGQEGENESDGAKGEGRPPAYILSPDAGDQADQHGDPRDEHQESGDQAGCLIAGAHLVELTLPRFGDLQELGVPADEVTLDTDPIPVGPCRNLEAGQLPGEEVVDSVRALRRFRLDELETAHVELDHLRQKLFRQPTRQGLRQAGPGGLFLDEVGEADQVPCRRVLNVVFFLLQFAEPAVAPAPQAHRVVNDVAGALESSLPLEESLGLVVELEDPCVPEFVQVEALLLEERGGSHA